MEEVVNKVTNCKKRKREGGKSRSAIIPSKEKVN